MVSIPPAIVIAGDVMGLAVVRSLAPLGVPVTVAYRAGAGVVAASRYVADRIQVPHPAEDEAGVVDRLVDAGPRLRGGVLIPASDEMLIVVSRHKASLHEWYHVACDEWPVVEQFVDKQFTYALADRAGVPSPRTVVMTSREEMERVGKEVEYPVLVKPSQSHLYSERFRRKLTQVENIEELRVAFTEAQREGLDVLLQQLIVGDDTQGTSYNCYMWDGEPLVEFTSRKVRLLPERFGRPTSMVSRRIPELIEPGRRLLSTAKYHGFANVEFKRDARDGVHKLMEVNARINLASLLALRSGINFPWLMYRHLAFGEVPQPIQQTTGTYWIDGGRDIASGMAALIGRRTSLRSFVRPYFRRRVFAVYDWRDPGPALARYGGFARSAARKALTRLPGVRA